MSIFLSNWPNPGCPSISPTSVTSSQSDLQNTHVQHDTDIRGVSNYLVVAALLEPCYSVVGALHREVRCQMGGSDELR